MSDLDEEPQQSLLRALKNTLERTMEGTLTSEGDVIRLSCGHYFFSVGSITDGMAPRWSGSEFGTLKILNRDPSTVKTHTKEASILWVAEKDWAMAGQTSTESSEPEPYSHL